MRTLVALSLLTLLAPIDPEPYWVGWYHGLADAEELPELAKNGVTLVRGGHDHALKKFQGHKEDVVKTYLDAAKAAGVKVLLHLPGTWTKSGKLDELKDWIQKWKDHPAIYAWYLYDEPEIHKVTPEQLQAAYRAVKSVDDKHPVGVCFAPINKLKSITDFAACYDLLIFDYYPCRSGGEFPAPIKGWSKLVQDQVNKARELKKSGFIMALQGFEETGCRAPTTNEVRYLFYTTVIRDTVGALFFCEGWAPEKTRKAVHDVLREFKSLSLRTGRFMDSSVQCSSLAIKWRLHKDHLIAINETDVPVETKISAWGKSFSHKFDKYEVRIFNR